MTTKEMIEAMAAKKLWQSPNGKTPAATLYSAILREVTTKGKDSRFQKTEPGKFAATDVTENKEQTATEVKPAKSKAAKGAKTKATNEDHGIGGAQWHARDRSCVFRRLNHRPTQRPQRPYKGPFTLYATERPTTQTRRASTWAKRCRPTWSALPAPGPTDFRLHLDRHGADQRCELGWTDE